MALLLAVSVFLSLLDKELVDLNTADPWELQTLPGIGEVRAAGIVEFRDRFGPFLELDDLLDVPGIGPATLSGFADMVCISVPEESSLSDTLHWMRGAIEDTLLTVAFLDVGQGDAILLVADSGQTWLVDGGPDEGGPMFPTVLIRLWELGVDSIDVVALSHPHADHIGGLASVISELEVGKLLDPGLRFYSPVYETLLETALEHGLEYALLDSGDVFELSSDVLLEVISMEEEGSASPSRANEQCSQMLVTCGRFSMLLTGDIGIEGEMHTFAAMSAVNVLKVPHHGSISGAFEPYFRKLRPQISVISVGRNNPFGHPHPSVIGMLVDLGSIVLRTDSAGTIFLRTDGRAIQLTGSAR